MTDKNTPKTMIDETEHIAIELHLITYKRINFLANCLQMSIPKTIHILTENALSLLRNGVVGSDEETTNQ